MSFISSQNTVSKKVHFVPSSLKNFLLFQIFQGIERKEKNKKKEQKVIGLRLMRIRFKKSEIGRDFWTKVLGKRSAVLERILLSNTVKIVYCSNFSHYWSQSERTNHTRLDHRLWVPSGESCSELKYRPHVPKYGTKQKIEPSQHWPSPKGNLSEL